MRALTTAIVWAVLAAGQSLPPPFPRPNAVKMLENDRVQVWNVSWPKGQATALHRHLYDITGVYYTTGDRLITDADGSKRPVTNAAGGITWQFKGLTHIEEGTSDQPLRAVMIELKQDKTPAPPDAPSEVRAWSGNGIMPMLDNERVTVWEYVRPAGVQEQHRHTHDAVVVWITGQTPHATFLPRGTIHSVEQIDAAQRATIFELK